MLVYGSRFWGLRTLARVRARSLMMSFSGDMILVEGGRVKDARVSGYKVLFKSWYRKEFRGRGIEKTFAAMQKAKGRAGAGGKSHGCSRCYCCREVRRVTP